MVAGFLGWVWVTDGDMGLGCEVQRTVVQFSLCAPVVLQGCSPVRGGVGLGGGSLVGARVQSSQKPPAWLGWLQGQRRQPGALTE